MAPNSIGSHTFSLPTVSVVIPTLGRDSLIAAIKSVNEQTYQPIEILVVCEQSVAEKETLVEVSKLPLVRVCTNNNGGASGNRNQGIDESVGDYIAFLDDDDSWRPLKLEKQIKAAIVDDWDLVSCKGFFEGYRNGEVPKSVYMGNSLLVELLYGRWSFRSREYGILTPTIIVKKEIAKKIKFDPEYTEREDLHFLDKFQEFGFRINQIEDVLVQINSTKPFKRRKTPLNQDLIWFDYIFKKNPNLAWKFLITVAIRNRLLDFQMLSVIDLLSQAIRRRS